MRAALIGLGSLALSSTLGTCLLLGYVDHLRAELRRHHLQCSDCKGNDAERRR